MYDTLYIGAQWVGTALLPTTALARDKRSNRVVAAGATLVVRCGEYSSRDSEAHWCGQRARTIRGSWHADVYVRAFDLLAGCSHRFVCVCVRVRCAVVRV